MSQRIRCEGNDHGSARNTLSTFEYSCHFADFTATTAGRDFPLQHRLFENFYGEQFCVRDVFRLIS